MTIKAVTSKNRVAVHPWISFNPKMTTLISNVRTLGSILLVVSIVSGLPAVNDTLKPKEIPEDGDKVIASLALDLMPPSMEADEGANVTLYIINLYAVRNHSADSSEDVIDNTLQEKMPDIIGPLATVFLVVQEGGDEEPVDLDEMAKFLETQGFKMDKIEESGETSVLRTEVPTEELDDVKDMLESTSDNSLKEKGHKSKKYRVRRMACHKCHHGGGGGGGYGKGGGGGYGGGGTYDYYAPNGGGGTVGVIPVYVVPVSIQTQPVQRPQYHPQPAYHPSGGGCDPCQGGGGGGRGGGGGAWATASASAGSW